MLSVLMTPRKDCPVTVPSSTGAKRLSVTCQQGGGVDGVKVDAGEGR